MFTENFEIIAIITHLAGEGEKRPSATVDKRKKVSKKKGEGEGEAGK
jgi:hypothetical protein